MLLLHLFIIIREYRNVKKNKKRENKKDREKLYKSVTWKLKFYEGVRKKVLHILEKSVNKYRKSVTDK